MWPKPGKYYAVAKGHVPGIYDNWPDTKKQVYQFSYCDFRKFYCWDDCFRYLRSHGLTESDFEFNCGRTKKEKHNPHRKFYAVVIGRRPGLYTLWENCKDQVLGYKGADWKTFDCRFDAKQFLKRRGIRDYYKEDSKLQVPNPLENILYKRDKEGRVEVYADGFVGATAGIGVWWDVDHPLNLAAPVEGTTATNIVAEIQAVTAAARIAVEFKIDKLKVYTNSEYLIKCMGQWWEKWILNGFMTVQNKAVENKEMLQDLKRVMEKVDVQFEFVRAHTGIKGNAGADGLAKEGAKKMNNNH